MSTVAASPEPLLIAVIGATGAQGGGVARALLAADGFKVRAITRDAESEKAKALVAEGATVVQADLNDKPSLIKAFKGADGLFVVTDFFGAGNYDMEVAQGKNAAEAAKEAGIKHVVFSSLEDTRKYAKGKLRELPGNPGHVVAHFESKAAIEEYMKELGIPLTVLITSGFFQNWIKVTQYMPQEDGSFLVSHNAGDAQVPFHDVNDIGHSTAAIFANRANYLGATVPVVRQVLTFPEMARIISEETGLRVNYQFMPDDKFWALSPALHDISNMWQYVREFVDFKKLRPLDKTVYIGKSFQEWVRENKEQLKATILSFAKK